MIPPKFLLLKSRQKLTLTKFVPLHSLIWMTIKLLVLVLDREEVRKWKSFRLNSLNTVRSLQQRMSMYLILPLIIVIYRYIR